MTKTEFESTKFSARMKCYYREHLYVIKGVDFMDGTIWICPDTGEQGEWKTYKEVKIVK